MRRGASSSRPLPRAGLSLSFLLAVFLCGCATPQPQNVDNICEIFRENTEWYDDARKSYEKWRIPIPVLIAILHQESKFISDARPPRTTCLWVLPGPRPSSAYGYSQAMNGTWDQYRKSTGNKGADRDDFGDSVDFVGWYCDLSSRKCNISRSDAYNLYLAYHEGHGGFNRSTHQQKPWLLGVANKVQARATKYKGQLASCEQEFLKKRPCCLWPF